MVCVRFPDDPHQHPPAWAARLSVVVDEEAAGEGQSPRTWLLSVLPALPGVREKPESPLPSLFGKPPRPEGETAAGLHFRSSPGRQRGRRRGFLLAAGGLPRPSGQPAPRIALPGPRRRARGDPASPRTGEAAAPQASCSDPVRGRRIVVKFLMKMNKAVQAKNFRKVRLTVGFLTGFSGLSSNPILYERNSAANVKHCPSCFSPFIQPLRPFALASDLHACVKQHGRHSSFSWSL